MTPNSRFPSMRLAVQPPLSPVEPREGELPSGAGWIFQPSLGGLRCLAFRSGDTVALQGKSGQPITRYFPELVMALSRLPEDRFVLDGEIVIPAARGQVDPEKLAARMHPSARRIAQLSATVPATFVATDLLCDDDVPLSGEKLADRRKRLEAFFRARVKPQVLVPAGVALCPSTAKRPEALAWISNTRGAAGVVARRSTSAYPGNAKDSVRVKNDKAAAQPLLVARIEV